MTHQHAAPLLHGSCLCGDVRFALHGPVTLIKSCHCSQCRKMSGGAAFSYARALVRDFRPLRGFDALQLYERRPGNVIAFCRRCGTLVPHPPPGSELLEFGAGCPAVAVCARGSSASRSPRARTQRRTASRATTTGSC
jgi:hypothetical protein